MKNSCINTTLCKDENPLEGSITFEGDILSPIDEDWTPTDFPTEE
jgi:hypothetical protein